MNRGMCPVCGYSWAVTKNRGLLVRHHNSRLRERSRLCLGVGKPCVEAIQAADAALAAPPGPEKDRTTKKS